MSVSQKASTESDILAALKANNPFEKPPVVKDQNIWGESFPDVPALNAIASDTVFEALEKARSADSTFDKVASIVLIADRGVGKSHVIKRIRRRLQASEEGVLIYASADKYGELDYINALFQQSMAESLEQIGSAGVTQWQEIATLMVAEALSTSNANANLPAAQALVGKFDKAWQNSRQNKQKDLVGELAKVIRRKRPNTDPYILRAIIWTLSEERGSFAVKWLAGEQLDRQDAADLRLPQQEKSEGERDASALTRITKILSLISEYKSVSVCFDELDTHASNRDGYTTEIVILDLVKRLFDSIGPTVTSKGIVLLTVVLPDIWRTVRQTKIASEEKISSHGKPIVLNNLSAETVRELASATLQKFYRKKGLTPATPIYPFEEEELAQYGKNRPYAREALIWFAAQINEKLKILKPVSVSPTERLKDAYDNALSQFDAEELEDNELIAAALRFGFEKITEIDRLKDQPIEGVVIGSVEDITPKSQNGGWIQFKVVGKENGEPVTIGVSALQYTTGRPVGAGFRRLLDTETFGLSRSCLVRSRDRKIKRYWDSFEYYQQLVASGGEWVDLVIEEIKPLLALQYVYEHHEKFDLTLRRLNSFAFTRDLLTSNSLLKEILSRPTGAVAEDALEGETLERLNEGASVETIEIELSQALADESLLDETEMRSSLEDVVEAISA